MFEKLFWAGIGGFVVYLLMKNPETAAKLDSDLDSLRENIHDLVKKYAPEADDLAVGNDVITTVK